MADLIMEEISGSCLKQFRSDTRASMRPSAAHKPLLIVSALTVAQWGREETSDGLDEQDASRPRSVDSEAVPRGEQTPHKEGHFALTLPCPLCERETSQSVFINKTTGGWCALPARSTVSWSTCGQVELS